MSKGCPRIHPETAPIQKPDDSKHTARCCSVKGNSCTSNPCHADKTYEEAAEICSSMGLCLCLQKELDICCATGCGYDDTMNWVADTAEGMNKTFNYMIIRY